MWLREPAQQSNLSVVGTQQRVARGSLTRRTERRRGAGSADDPTPPNELK